MTQKISRHLFLWKAAVFWKVEMPEYFLQDNPLKFYEMALKTFVKISCFPACNARIRMQWVCSCLVLIFSRLLASTNEKTGVLDSGELFGCLGIPLCTSHIPGSPWHSLLHLEMVSGKLLLWLELRAGDRAGCPLQGWGYRWVVHGEGEVLLHGHSSSWCLVKRDSQNWSGTRISVNQSRPSLAEMVEQRSCKGNI